MNYSNPDAELQKVANIHVSGYAFIKGEYFDSHSITKYLRGIGDLAGISAEISSFNGSYSVVVEMCDGKTLLAVDYVRSYPLFYDENGCWATSAFDLAGELPMRICSHTAQFLKQVIR